MAVEYKIIRDPFLGVSDNSPIERAITDILTDRDRGFSVSIIENPVEGYQTSPEIGYEMLTKPRLAFNQGPTNHKHLVLLNSPEKIRTGEGLTWVLDNAFDEKEFYVLPENMKKSVWGQSEKAENYLLFLGNPEEVIKEFEELGYTFLDKFFEVRAERFERIREMSRD